MYKKCIIKSYIVGRLRYDIYFDLFGGEKYSLYVHLDKEYVQYWIVYRFLIRKIEFTNQLLWHFISWAHQFALMSLILMRWKEDKTFWHQENISTFMHFS